MIPSFRLKCPNCGRSTQYNLLSLKERFKDHNRIKFSCMACNYTAMLTPDKFPGLSKALRALEKSK